MKTAEVNDTNKKDPKEESGKLKARLITFYLPQFHPIPENDEWWGKGFTEWRNVTGAKPLFRGHYQPSLPADLGYYDLRLPEIRFEQAQMARKYGIEGFCYWHYWFNGKMLLERPVKEVVSSGEPDFPFCLAWANETWSRHWDGEPHSILQDQTYGSEADDRRHFEWLLPALSDPRAIKIDGKPVFMIYKAKFLPDCRKTTDLWRELAVKHGLPGLYLLSIETHGTYGWDPRQGGFDAAVEFQPYWMRISEVMKKISGVKRSIKNLIKYGDKDMFVVDYRTLWPHLISPEVDYPLYRGVCPRWDNTPRRGKKGLILIDSSPDEYGKWLRQTVELVKDQPSDHRIIFINAWNEWAEGNYLEPDLRFGHAYLEATYEAVKK